MADWFHDLVTQVSDDVAGSPDTATLKPTDQLTRADLVRAAVASEDGLRTQFSERIRTVQDLRDKIEQAEQRALPRAWQAVMTAGQRVQEAQSQPTTQPGWASRLARKLFAPSGGPPGWSPQAQAQHDLDAAMQAYRQAKEDQNVDDRDDIRKLVAEMEPQERALREAVRSELARKINALIDSRRAASFKKAFSFDGAPIVSDPLKQAEQPVVTDDYQTIRGLIRDRRSGAIGVSGPRGSGKSTLLRQFAATRGSRRHPDQWGVYVPAPVKYDSRDFLLYLCGQLCLEVLGPDQARALESELTSAKPSMRRLLPSARVLGVLAAAVLACLAMVIGLRTARLGLAPHVLTDLEIASCSTIVLFLVVADFFISPAYLLRRNMPRFMALLVVSLIVIAVIALFALLLFGDAPDPGYLAVGGLGLASVIVFFLAAYVLRRREYMSREHEEYGPAQFYFDDRELVTEARKLYKNIKFQQSYTTGWSGTITVGTSSLPVQAQGGASGSSQVTPVAMSTPEIAGAINGFIKALASVPRRDWAIPVVIGIDELDKIDDPSEAQAFFNQIKGLFADDSSRLFLVSISDDAMAAFERRGTPFRDAFDSSLSSVITLSYLSRDQARTLIGSRLVGIPEPAADLLFLLSGGLARDLVRLIGQAVQARKPDPEQTTLDDLMLALMSAEMDTKKKAVLVRARALQSCPGRDEVLAWAVRHQAAAADAQTYLAGLLADAASLIDSACDGTAHQIADQRRPSTDTGDCPAEEIGVFCLWLATVGQVFSRCSTEADFEAGESATGEKSFERLAQARQGFQLGLDYVLTATRAFRGAWGLANEPSVTDDVILFQYGSNMSVADLESKLSQHSGYAPAGTRMKILSQGPARLAGWQFTIDLFSAGRGSLVADIREGPDQDEVWGVAYRLDRRLVIRPDGKRSVLDRIEGHRPERDPENYHLREVRVALGEELISAYTYVGTDDARRRCREDHPDAVVKPAYRDAVLDGAAQAVLPADYQMVLREVLTAAGRDITVGTASPGG